MNSLYHVGKLYFLTCFLLIGSHSLLFAQPGNDDCADAIFLDQPF